MHASDTHERHVLVADDEAHIGRIIKLKMEQGPFRVTLAFDGQEAVDVLEQSDRIDAAVLDVMMPRLSSREDQSERGYQGCPLHHTHCGR
jgi:CheY-like chemotaxis protein